MSATPNKQTFLPTPKAVELVNKLIEKTKLKKLEWKQVDKSLIAGLSSDLFVRFQISRLGSGELTWTKFAVKSQNETVLEFDNSFSLNSLLASAMASSNPVLSAVHRLFSLVANVGEAGIERAIRALDEL